MTADDIKIANGDRIATDAITEDSLTRHRQRVIVDNSATPSESLHTLLSADGLGVTTAMNVDGSSGVDYEYIVPASKIAYVTRLCGSVVDTGGSWTAVKFGSLTALTNGCTIKALDTDDSVLEDFLDGTTIKNNAHWARIVGVDGFLNAFSAQMVALSWQLHLAYGGPFVLTAGQKLQIKLQDDLSAITEWEMMAQGRLIAA